MASKDLPPIRIFDPLGLPCVQARVKDPKIPEDCPIETLIKGEQACKKCGRRVIVNLHNSSK